MKLQSTAALPLRLTAMLDAKVHWSTERAIVPGILAPLLFLAGNLELASVVLSHSGSLPLNKHLSSLWDI